MVWSPHVVEVSEVIFGVSELASLPIEAIVMSMVVCVAQCLLVVLCNMLLLLEFVMSMGKCTLISKGTLLTSQPELAQLCFGLHPVIIGINDLFIAYFLIYVAYLDLFR